MGGRIWWADEKKLPKIPQHLLARIRTGCTGNTFGVDVETILCLSSFAAERKASAPTRWNPSSPSPENNTMGPPLSSNCSVHDASAKSPRGLAYRLLSTMAPYTRRSVVALAPCLGSFRCFCSYKIFRSLRI